MIQFKATTIEALKAEFLAIGSNDPETLTAYMIALNNIIAISTKQSKDDEPEPEPGQGEKTKAEIIAEAVNKIIHLDGLNIDLCGSWVWVSGETKQHKDVLKSAGFWWSNGKSKWYFKTETRRKFYKGKYNYSQIVAKYGREEIKA